MGCGGPKPDKNIGRAAQSQVALSKEALDWFKQEYANTADDRADATARANQLSDAQLESMQTQTALAKDYDTYNKTTFRPLEQRLVSEAENYDTPERQAAEAAAAGADVQQQADIQQGAMQRNLARSGVAPGSGASLAMMSQGALQTAKARAGAENAARQRVEATGYARMADAANMGRGLPSAQATAMQTGIGAGQASLAASGQGAHAAQSGAALMQTGFNTALNANQSAGNLYAQRAQLANSGSDLGAMMGGVGGIMQGLGAMGISSSKAKKRNKRPVSDEAALEQVNKLPVEQWDYKPGVADEGRHVGPYAEDVQRVMGEQTAPGGRMVDLVRMNDANEHAIRALTKELAGLESKLAQLEH